MWPAASAQQPPPHPSASPKQELRRCSSIASPGYSDRFRSSTGAGRAETEPDIIGDPGPGFVHQDGPEQISYFAARPETVGLRHRAEEIFGKRVKPRLDPGRQNSRPRDDNDLLDSEAGAFELLSIGVGGRKIPGVQLVRVETAAGEHGAQGDDDSRRVVVTAHLSDKAAVWLQHLI